MNVWSVKYHLAFVNEEAAFEVGYDDERDHFRLPLSEVASRIALTSEDAITAELRIHTASSTM